VNELCNLTTSCAFRIYWNITDFQQFLDLWIFTKVNYKKDFYFYYQPKTGILIINRLKNAQYYKNQLINKTILNAQQVLNYLVYKPQIYCAILLNTSLFKDFSKKCSLLDKFLQKCPFSDTFCFFHYFIMRLYTVFYVFGMCIVDSVLFRCSIYDLAIKSFSLM